MFDKSIRNKIILYIISLFLISSFFINIDILAEDTLTAEPFEIWQENSAFGEIESTKKNTDMQEISNTNRQTVQQENFSFTKADAIGLYDPTNGGFEANLWEGSNIEDIAHLINIMPSNNSSSTLNNLIRKAILTTSAPPDNLNNYSLLDLILSTIEESSKVLVSPKE